MSIEQFSKNIQRESQNGWTCISMVFLYDYLMQNPVIVTVINGKVSTELKH